MPFSSIFMICSIILGNISCLVYSKISSAFHRELLAIQTISTILARWLTGEEGILNLIFRTSSEGKTLGEKQEL